jgi:hypothetical protein
MSDETSTAQAARTATEPWKPVPKRRRPKTTEEQLADAMARADALKAKALTQRDGLRMDLVEDLYLRFYVGEIDGDVCERKRLAALRAALDL